MNKAILAALLAVFWSTLAARDVKFERIESEIGDELGFSIFRASTELDDEEVFFVVERHEAASGEKRTYVHWWVGHGTKARFAVTTVKSDMFVPDARHIILRNGSNRRTFADAFVEESGYGGPEGLYLRIAWPGKPDKERFAWQAQIVPRAEYEKLYPDSKLPQPQQGGMSSGSFVVR